MTGCKRQCDWDDEMVCRSCGIDYSPPKPSKDDDDDDGEQE